jgi:hypothetical protein
MAALGGASSACEVEVTATMQLVRRRARLRVYMPKRLLARRRRASSLPSLS